MIRWFVACWVLAGFAASGQDAWLTVAGEPDRPDVNTIQVDPSTRVLGDAMLTMKVRVSRSNQRTSWDGIPYRSYESVVSFDCQNRTARYLTIHYFEKPLWEGQSYRTGDYSRGVPRFMAFRDVEPNPNVRIVNAACAILPK
ncbi:MAG: hypothetical protein H7255_19130 [Ramlibacter sp.]|nr:hypothetical protein [Ramlibacter sp.]